MAVPARFAHRLIGFRYFGILGGGFQLIHVARLWAWQVDRSFHVTDHFWRCFGPLHYHNMTIHFKRSLNVGSGPSYFGSWFFREQGLASVLRWSVARFERSWDLGYLHPSSHWYRCYYLYKKLEAILFPGIELPIDQRCLFLWPRLSKIKEFIIFPYCCLKASAHWVISRQSGSRARNCSLLPPWRFEDRRCCLWQNCTIVLSSQVENLSYHSRFRESKYSIGLVIS